VSSPDAAASAADADRTVLDPPPWDESKVVALQSIGVILNDFLVPKIVHLPSFAVAWETFVTQSDAHFYLMGMPLTGAAKGLRPSLVETWEKPWTKCEEMGAVVVRRASASAQHVDSPAPFTQESLVVFVGVNKCVRCIRVGR